MKNVRKPVVKNCTSILDQPLTAELVRETAIETLGIEWVEAYERKIGHVMCKPSVKVQK